MAKFHVGEIAIAAVDFVNIETLTLIASAGAEVVITQIGGRDIFGKCDYLGEIAGVACSADECGLRKRRPPIPPEVVEIFQSIGQPACS